MEEFRVAQLAALFDRALDVPQSQRDEFVQEVCGNDTELREELSSLLAADETAAEYFEELAAQIVAPAYTALIDPADASHQSDLLPRLQAALANTYRIEHELTGGAMSRVFLAEEIKLGRKVVIKVLPPDMAASVNAERFRREIQVAAQLQHPHIVPLLASDSSESLLYYTMPFVAGESLQARLAREGALSVGDATAIWRDVLDALAHAHGNGVVHRDIKPANILLGRRNALVTDFGIARAIEAAAEDASLTATGLAIGTPTYMAPEQVIGSPDADHRMDIYAAGLVMYEMLEGRPPFSGSSTRELVLVRLTRNPAPLKNPCPPRTRRSRTALPGNGSGGPPRKCRGGSGRTRSSSAQEVTLVALWTRGSDGGCRHFWRDAVEARYAWRRRGGGGATIHCRPSARESQR